jgi:hypothetical protein
LSQVYSVSNLLHQFDGHWLWLIAASFLAGVLGLYRRHSGDYIAADFKG